MIEIEKTKRAYEYIIKLANGINPLTEDAIEEDGLLNDARLCRCFFHVADVLKQVLDAGGEVYKENYINRALYTDGAAKKSKPQRFIYDVEQIKTVEVSPNPLTITSFVSFIHNQIGLDGGKISYKAITAWLLEQGYLQVIIRNDKQYKESTPKGQAIGISTIDRHGADGQFYRVVLYDSLAQQFILDNLQEILQKS